MTNPTSIRGTVGVEHEDVAARNLGYRDALGWLNTVQTCLESGEKPPSFDEYLTIFHPRRTITRTQKRLVELLEDRNPTVEVVAELKEMGALTADGRLTAGATRAWFDALDVIDNS